MSSSSKNDDKERYLTYSIALRAANKEKEIKEEHWNAEDKFLNTTILLEGDLKDAFDDAAISDDDVRMEEDFIRALRTVSIVVLPVGYNEKLQEDLWGVKKPRNETSPEYSKRFRALLRMENTLSRLYESSPMAEGALYHLYKRGLPIEWQNKYHASGQVYTSVAALVPFFKRFERGEQRLHHRGGLGGNNHRNNNQDRTHNQGCRGNTSQRRNNNSGGRQQNRGGNRGRGNSNGNSNGSSTGNKYCTFHRTTTHNTTYCRALRHDNQQEDHQQVDQRRGPRAAPSQQRQTEEALATTNICSWD
ncbi:hypothetical protein PC113_g20619 [Phytophthora cactorum]|uniref:Uncharacterized protein n=2 Tax=Phytophthora cactorum TaxID=29920 RepID=A0A8T0Y821_9STRA|nr:hypothetical protein PC112_g20702 [Phytophthora cactorum]KAG2833206.1 hypothetical protein PC113_g20619 [Phytophthora cactorum]